MTDIIIPKTLEEAFDILDEMNIKDIEDWLKDEEGKAIGQSHHGLGMWLRNNWGLWHSEPFWDKNTLNYWFNEMGIFHADDMSSIILTSYHRIKNGKEVKLEKQVQHYLDFWKKTKQK